MHMWTFTVSESEEDKWQVDVFFYLKIDLRTLLLDFSFFYFSKPYVSWMLKKNL